MDVNDFANFLGVVVVVACLFLKVPQIYNIVKSGSSKGLSLPSVLMEFWCYTVNLTYGLANSYPLTTYLEYSFLVLQDVIVLVLIIRSRKLFHPVMFIGVFLYFLLAYSFAIRFWTAFIMQFIISMNMPMICGSKLTQLLKIYRAKKPGQASAASWFIATFTSGSRIVTTLLLTGDVALMRNFITGFTLNLANVAAILYYGSISMKVD